VSPPANPRTSPLAGPPANPPCNRLVNQLQCPRSIQCRCPPRSRHLCRQQALRAPHLRPPRLHRPRLRHRRRLPPLRPLSRPLTPQRILQLTHRHIYQPLLPRLHLLVLQLRPLPSLVICRRSLQLP
jgi:hypothetical protein